MHHPKNRNIDNSSNHSSPIITSFWWTSNNPEFLCGTVDITPVYVLVTWNEGDAERIELEPRVNWPACRRIPFTLRWNDSGDDCSFDPELTIRLGGAVTEEATSEILIYPNGHLVVRSEDELEILK